MKRRILLALICFLSLSAQAQTSTESMTANQQTDRPALGETSSQSLTTATEEAESKYKHQFLAEFWDETSTGVQSITDHKFGAGISSLYTMGLGYKLTSKLLIGVQQRAYSRSNFNDMGDSDVEVFQAGDKTVSPEHQVLGDVILKSVYTSDSRFWGSEAWAPMTRYFFGTSDGARGVGRTGYFRTDLGATWVLNPKINFDLVFSPRITFQNANSKYGKDAIYHLVVGPTFTYNFSDKMNIYSATAALLDSTEAQRGRPAIDVANTLNPEIGMNFIFGDVTVNPAVDSYASMSNSENHIFSADSRIFAAENSTYNLNIYANF